MFGQRADKSHSWQKCGEINYVWKEHKCEVISIAIYIDSLKIIIFDLKGILYPF